jgi:DNA modification methylase
LQLLDPSEASCRPAAKDRLMTNPAVSADRWPATKVEMWPVEDLIPYARNARTHPEEQVAQIAASMERFGFTIPMLVAEDGTIIAGHGRLLAAQRLGIPEVPVMIARGWSNEDRRLYTLADNRLAETSEWDPQTLRLELEELKVEAGEDALAGIGFSDEEIAELIPGMLTEAGAGLTDPDDIPEAGPDPISAPGDVWLLGGHRIICGSSTDKDTVAAVLAGAKPHLMVTDPPYGVNYDPEWREKAGVGGPGIAKGKVLNDDKADWREAWALFPGDVAYVWHAGLFAGTVAESLQATGFKLRSQIMWDKGQLVLSRGDYHWQHEPCQPAGTMISKVVKEGRLRESSVIEQVPIETLKAGDKVVSFGNAKVFRRGREITRVGSRKYSGNLHSLKVGERTTRATAEHQFTVRFNPQTPKAGLLYLMRRGERWRIGVCGMFNSRGFGLAVRVSQEMADEAWIISAFADLKAARIAEQAASCVYGIPTTHWETGRSASTAQSRTKAEIDAIYQRIGVARVQEGAQRLMMDHGLSADHPLITAGIAGSFSRKASRVVRACNLVPGIMQVPVPTKGEDFQWEAIDRVDFEAVDGLEVWSMDVDQDHHYVADGIVTHNCWYAVREGKTGHWAGDRKQTTVWQIPKPSRSETGHGTQKPVDCMRRPIENNSEPGDAIYEPFSGSGTTIMAAELTGRVCFAVELNPIYVDVAVRRWQEYTGREAVLESSGETFAETEKARQPQDSAAA